MESPLKPTTAALTLLETPLWHLFYDRQRDITVMRRKPTSFETLEQLIKDSNLIIPVLRNMPPARGMVVDLREARANNDPAFEQAILPLREATGAAYPRVAFLTASAVGLLHVRRLSPSANGQFLFTFNETEALEFLAR